MKQTLAKASRNGRIKKVRGAAWPPGQYVETFRNASGVLEPEVLMHYGPGLGPQRFRAKDITIENPEPIEPEPGS